MYNNNFGYNPYYQPQRYVGVPQQPIQQPIEQQSTMSFNSTQNRSVLNGKQVDSIDVVKATDIPLDGSVSYFPIADGSAIVTKQIQENGTSKMVVFKPVEETKASPKYVTSEELEKSLKNIDLSEIDDIKDDIKDIKSELKDLKKKKKEE